MSGVAGGHLEAVLETEICQHLEANGWLYSPDDTGYDKALALFPDDVLGWFADTQPTQYAKVVRPGDSLALQEAAKTLLLGRLVKALDNDPFKHGGTLNVLRNGFSFVPPSGGSVKVQLAQFRPATGLNPDTLAACGWPAHPESGVPAAVDRAAGSQMTAWHRRGMTMAKRIIGAVIWIFPMVSNGCE